MWEKSERNFVDLSAFIYGMNKCPAGVFLEVSVSNRRIERCARVFKPPEALLRRSSLDC
jgi:hypothetical protein